MRRDLALGALLLLAVLPVGAAQAQALAYDDEALRDVIEDVERRTEWRFLYSDALVASKHVRLRADAASFPDALADALQGQGVGVESDGARRRILLVPVSKPAAVPRVRVVRGRVLDGETGEPLPFATVTWEGGRRGVVADEAGAFVLTLRAADGSPPPALTASFVGYEAQTAAPRGEALSFRLQPEAGAYPAVVVNALTFSAPVDTAWASRLRPGLYDAVGEGGGLRALDVLPSVAPSAAFDEGLIVRGSASDAFEVRLDGVPVYNPRHLFGLVDAFNGDALRAVALYVGVAPARVDVAPGGAVEYVTATGSPRGPAVEAGVSSLAARGAVSVPIRPGRTTVLVGGRTSLLGASPWIGDALVEEGLGVVRQTSPLPAATTEAFSRVVEVESTSASFWDLHVGGADERAGGGRTAVTVYAGGDDTSLEALRFFGEQGDAPAARRPVATRNRWGSRAVSVSDQRSLTSRLVLHSRLGGSAYDARFGQSDFTFNPDRLNPLAAFVDTLGYDNELREGIVAQRLDAVLGGGLASGGYSLHVYRQRYEETAAFRPTFVADQTATRLDLHAEWSGRALPTLDLAAGVRTHLYSAGGVRVSPRVRARVDVAPGLAVSAAIGRSAQFLHRLTLGDAVGAAAWVLSDESDTVTEADLAEATVDARAGGVTAQLTGYIKRTRGQWLHVDDRAVRNLADRTVLQLPWLSDVDSRARGLEALVRIPVRPWSLGASAALARVDLQHPALGDGEPFPADWDRRLQATFLADGPILPGLWLATAWTVASGAPNPLANRVGEEDRLAPISRLDLRLTARRRWGGTTASLSVAVRNVLDQDNAVTRESTTVLRRTLTGQARLGRVPLDVYDAGFLPTFDLALRW